MGVSSGLENSVGSWASVFNLGNCAIGAGILSFPHAVQRSGLLGGIIICFLLAAVELFTLNILARQATKHRAITYQGLVLTVLGPRAAEVVAWFIFLFLFGSCVAFMIIVGDTFHMVLLPYVIRPLGLPTWLAARRVMVLAPAITIMLPLSLRRSLGSLAGASTIAVAVMMATTVVIVVKAALAAAAGVDGDGEKFLEGVQLFRFDAQTFSAMPVMIFAYHCHVQSVPIYFELTDSPSLLSCLRRRHAPPPPAAAVDADDALAAPDIDTHTEPCADGIARTVAAKLRGMYHVPAAAYGECTIMYLATGIAGYVLFPRTTAANVLNNFAQSDTVMQVTRLAVGVAVVLHYPINQHVARSALYDLACKYVGVEAVQEDVPYRHVAAVTLTFFIACATTACAVSSLDAVLQFIGGIAGSLLIFVLPGALLVADDWTTLHRQGFARVSDGEASSSVAQGRAGVHARLRAPSGSGRDTEALAPVLADEAGPSSSTGAAARRYVDAAERSAAGGRPVWQEAWDRPIVGWALIIVGVCVIVLTLYMGVVQALTGDGTAAAGESAGLQAPFLVGADSRRSLRTLSVLLAA